IPAAADSPWAEAARLRDGFAAALADAAHQKGLRVLVSKSQPGVYPIAVEMIAWTPLQSATDVAGTRRERLNIAIEVNPYLQHPLTFTIDLHTRRKRFTKRRWRMAQTDVEDLALFTLGAKGMPAIMRGDFWRAIVAAIPGLNLLLDHNRLIAPAR